MEQSQTINMSKQRLVFHIHCDDMAGSQLLWYNFVANVSGFNSADFPTKYLQVFLTALCVLHNDCMSTAPALNSGLICDLLFERVVVQTGCKVTAVTLPSD